MSNILLESTSVDNWIEIGHPVQIKFGACGEFPMNATIVELSPDEAIANCQIWSTDPVAKEHCMEGMTVPMEFSRIVPLKLCTPPPSRGRSMSVSYQDMDHDMDQEEESALESIREYTPSLTETWNSFTQTEIGKYLLGSTEQPARPRGISDPTSPRSMNSLTESWNPIEFSPFHFSFDRPSKIPAMKINGYQIGEEVHVLVGEYWYSGKVQSISKNGNYVVRYKTNFGLTWQERSFFPSAVRRM